MGPLENLTRVDLDPNHQLRKFVDIARPATRRVMREFKGVRSDAEKVNPSILICPNSFINQAIGSQISDDEREDFARIAYFQELNVVLASRTRIIAELAKGQEGSNRLARFMAEQAIYAQATRSVDNNIRLGFAMYPVKLEQSGLVPGAVYELAEGEAEDRINFRNEHAPVPGSKLDDDLRLTRRVAGLLLLCMLEQVHTTSTLAYPNLHFIQEGGSYMFYEKRKKAFIPPAVRALHYGRVEEFSRITHSDKLTEILTDPHFLQIRATRGTHPEAIGINRGA